MGWEPIDFITPPAWQRFFARRVANTTLAIACAFSLSACHVGVEFFNGATRGFAVSLGPFWIGFGVLRRKQGEAG